MAPSLGNSIGLPFIGDYEMSTRGGGRVLLENGIEFVLTESGDFVLLEGNIGLIITTDTIADLQAYALNGLTEGQVFYVQSFNAPVNGVTDGGGGLFFLTFHAPAGGSGTPTGVNSFTIFASNTAGAYFYRQFQGPYLIEWSGADATGATDATSTLLAAIAAVPDCAILTTYRTPTYAINSEFKINNRTSLEFSCQRATDTDTGHLGATLVFGGTAGANLIELINSGFCKIKGWSLKLNHAGQGIAIGTDGTGTRISTQNTLEDLLLYQNLQTSDLTAFVSVGIGSFAGNNNEFMIFKNVNCEGAYQGSVSSATAIGFQFANNVNNHLHHMVNCDVIGAQVGIVAPWGGVHMDYPNDISFCQVAIQTHASNNGHAMTVEGLDCENVWTIVGTSGGILIKLSGCRFSGCGASGKALFDYTNGEAPALVVEYCEIDLGTVISTGGYLIDATGLSGGHGQVFRQNNYGGNAASAAGLIHGISLTSMTSTGLVFYCDRDELLTGSAWFTGEAPPALQKSSTSGAMLGVGGGYSTSVASGAITIDRGGSFVLCGTGDASTLTTININAAFPVHPIIWLQAHGGSVVIGNSGNINYSGTLTSGQVIALMYDGTTWQKSV